MIYNSTTFCNKYTHVKTLFFDDSSNIVFCTNRVHMAATDVKIVGICTESRPASNGTSLGVQNPKNILKKTC